MPGLAPLYLHNELKWPMSSGLWSATSSLLFCLSTPQTFQQLVIRVFQSLIPELVCIYVYWVPVQCLHAHVPLTNSWSQSVLWYWGAVYTVCCQCWSAGDVCEAAVEWNVDAREEVRVYRQEELCPGLTAMFCNYLPAGSYCFTQHYDACCGLSVSPLSVGFGYVKGEASGL